MSVLTDCVTFAIVELLSPAVPLLTGSAVAFRAAKFRSDLRTMASLAMMYGLVRLDGAEGSSRARNVKTFPRRSG